MLTRKQEKIIKSLHTKKGRQKTGLCLIEGSKSIQTAGKSVLYKFTPKDTDQFFKLVTTKTPQNIAAVAKIPEWKEKDIVQKPVIVVLDNIQDPGNTGSILRLCLGFNASLVLIDSVDPASPKVVRSSAGAVFSVPWLKIDKTDALNLIKNFDRPVYRLEKRTGAKQMPVNFPDKITVIAGSEGAGITLKITGTSIYIKHNQKLDSLNVGHALAILLSQT